MMSDVTLSRNLRRKGSGATAAGEDHNLPGIVADDQASDLLLREEPVLQPFNGSPVQVISGLGKS
jgi:hypothetical protein